MLQRMPFLRHAQGTIQPLSWFQSRCRSVQPLQTQRVLVPLGLTYKPTNKKILPSILASISLIIYQRSKSPRTATLLQKRLGRKCQHSILYIKQRFLRPPLTYFLYTVYIITRSSQKQRIHQDIAPYSTNLLRSSVLLSSIYLITQTRGLLKLVKHYTPLLLYLLKSQTEVYSSILISKNLTYCLIRTSIPCL